MSNAIKYTNKGGKISISSTTDPDNITVSVIDSGVGIKHENLEKLFKIEDSKSSTGTNNEKGTGLGLLLYKEFVEKHNGQIWVESDVGKGSVFHFTLSRG